MELKSIIILLVVIAAWIFLMAYVLPKAGVPT
jgi:hypothetical protein